MSVLKSLICNWGKKKPVKPLYVAVPNLRYPQLRIIIKNNILILIKSESIVTKLSSLI